jgi:FtsH-binding integral membrane protein
MSTFFIVAIAVNLFNVVMSMINTPSKMNAILGWTAAIAFTAMAGIQENQIKNNDDYKRGQVDAINGQISYHMVTNQNNVTSWVLLSQDSAE